MYKKLSVLSVHLPKSANPGVSEKKRRQMLLVLTMTFGVLILFPSAFSQTIKGSYSFNPDSDAAGLLAKLRSGDGAGSLKSFFGENNVYDEKLADLLVFIDKAQYTGDSGESHIILLKNGKTRKNLFGQKIVYVMVFVAEKEEATASVSKDIADKKTTEKITEKSVDQKPPEKTVELSTEVKKRNPLSVSQSSLDYTQGSGEFFISSVIRTIASIFSGKAIEKGVEVKKGEDISDKPVTVNRVGTSKKDKAVLFFGYVKIPVYENTINRITVEEDYGDDKISRHVGTFGNYSASRLTTSIGIMGTLVKAEEGQDKRVPVNAFLFGHVYFKRPQLPSPHYQNRGSKGYFSRLSLSLVGGTRISTNLFDDLFVGASLGHFISTVGLVAGVNFRTPTDLEGKPTGDKRRASFCAGLTMIF